MMDKIRGSCTPQLSSSESAALPSSDFTEKDLHEFFADRDPNCQRALAQSFVNQLQICPPSGCTAGQKSPACEKFQSDSIASLAKFRGSLVSEMPTLQASLTEPCRDRADALRAVQPLRDELRGAHSSEALTPASRLLPAVNAPTPKICKPSRWQTQRTKCVSCQTQTDKPFTKPD